MESHRKIVTRFAPSPTGQMHIGGVRTALYAWAYARKHHGTFILRIEDTDKAREVAGSMEHIIESLKWLNVNWDEGPDIGGPHAPYKQSERLETYNKYAQILIEKGFAYADPYTEADVEKFRQEAIEAGRPFLYRDYRPETTPFWDGSQPLRFKVPEIKSYAWNDLVLGETSAGPEALDDFILIKSDGYPTYNFAHIIDDLEMGVTHIMRGGEFLASTPKYLSLYEALGITRPEIATMPAILGEGGQKKLGKRDGAKDILDYRTEGYLPEAMLNFLAYIGWNPGDEREVLSAEEFIQAFDVEKVQRSGGQYNLEKLDWLNKEHIKRMSYEAQEERIAEVLPEAIKSLPTFSTERLHKMVPTIIEHITKFGDVVVMAEAGELDFFFTAPLVEVEKLSFKGIEKHETQTHLETVLHILSGIPAQDWDLPMIKDRIMSYADTLPKRGPVLHPMRYSLSGKDKSPDPFTIAYVLDKDETLARVRQAIAMLQ